MNGSVRVQRGPCEAKAKASPRPVTFFYWGSTFSIIVFSCSSFVRAWSPVAGRPSHSVVVRGYHGDVPGCPRTRRGESQFPAPVEREASSAVVTATKVVGSCCSPQKHLSAM